jgi:hypothetical protein
MIMQNQINTLKLETLKLQHEIAITEILVAVDKVNALKSEIFKIEAERDKYG